ncbi:MAG: alpha/beta hydrolase [bacterium]|nr:alpha/beta hydrolase [bacterium]
MKNALILHGTDFDKTKKQKDTNWFPWLKKELEKVGYEVWLPELPEAWHPDLERYWNFVKDFDFNKETLLIGHSSGGGAMFGILHTLLEEKKVKAAISVAGIMKDEEWGCEGLFKEAYDWEKIRKQSKYIYLLWSKDDPYVKKYHTDFLSEKLHIKPQIYKGKKHFNLEAGQEHAKIPEVLEIVKAL